jgi:hypothetical protein
MSPKFWEYYLAIEEDLANCSRYVEFSERNYDVYSNEFAKIIVLASAEIDTVLRELCALIAPGVKADSINRYFTVINAHYPKLVEMYVKIRRADLNLQPWKGWVKDKSPGWWGLGYNKIKHDRTNHFDQANLGNALQAVGALLIVILHYHNFVSGKEISVDFNRAGKLFTPETPDQGKGGMFLTYGIGN